jgi:anti-sigma B factor antagonist
VNEVPVPLLELLAASAAKLGELSVAASVCDSPPGLSLELTGSLDGNNSLEFGAVARAALQAVGGGDALILDLRSLTYISSTGVGAFTTLLAESRRKETFLFLRGMQQRVKAVFDVLGFSDFFSFLEARA